MESRVTPDRAAAAVILFRSPMPAELAQLAGSEWVPEAAWQLDGNVLTSPLYHHHAGPQPHRR
jgi:hypothetical protein